MIMINTSADLNILCSREPSFNELVFRFYLGDFQSTMDENLFFTKHTANIKRKIVNQHLKRILLLENAMVLL